MTKFLKHSVIKPLKFKNNNTPARTLSISGLKSRVLKLPFLNLKMMVNSGLAFFILKFSEPGQFSLFGQMFCTGQQQI